jgi:hypothetical protein
MHFFLICIFFSTGERPLLHDGERAQDLDTNQVGSNGFNKKTRRKSGRSKRMQQEAGRGGSRCEADDGGGGEGFVTLWEEGGDGGEGGQGGGAQGGDAGGFDEGCERVREGLGELGGRDWRGDGGGCGGWRQVLYFSTTIV